MFCALAATALASNWTMVCGGDIMLNGISPSRNPLAGVAKLFREADLAYANLEIPLTNSITRTKRKTPEELRRRDQFILKADPAHGQGLNACGFDLLSLGNNHGMDYGYGGLKQEQKILDGYGIKWAGAGKNVAEAERVAVVKVGNLRVGMISYLCFMSSGSLYKNTPATPTTPGVAALHFNGNVDAADRQAIQQKVQAARTKCDVLLVALHWGIERNTTPSRYQKDLGRAFVDFGADVVLGAHPHVLQGWETYRGKPILYSMGNLVSPLPGQTALFRLKFDGKKCTAVQAIPCGISGGRVSPHSGRTATAQIARIKGLCQRIGT